ncbi:MAG: DNA polymerase IV [Patescibacteria group bacterium]|jgi:nucleotidyltransferase/DNA polymerase involved in DNA repair
MVVHVDMNSYFASVEQQANPHLRNKPLGVCAYLNKNGCMIAASIEAKKRGAKVGMTLQEARSMCPGIVFVENDPPKYRAVTSRVFGILHEITDRVEHYSIDEAFLDLKTWFRDPAEAAWALARARLRIQSEVGDWLKCSIGIAPSKFLAKLASDLEKPNGLVVITPENLDSILIKLDLEDVCGIAKHMRRRLNKLGIYTLLQLKDYPVMNLMLALGKAGWQWHERLCGREADLFDVAGTRIPKSIGHSFCVPKRANDIPGAILGILIKLTERAGRRLRPFGLYARSMSVQACFHDWVAQAAAEKHVPRGFENTNHPFFAYEQAMNSSVSFSEPANDIFSLVGGATRALESMWDGKMPVTFLAVTLHDLVPFTNQLKMSLPVVIPDLIGNPESEWLDPRIRKDDKGWCEDDRVGDRDGKRVEATKAVDSIRDRYGEESIVFASMLGLDEDYAPQRIGFRKIEGLEMNNTCND